MILLIDNYDSFTYNVYQYVSEFYNDVVVYRNDKISIDEIKSLNPSGIIISPGPKTPSEAGISKKVIETFYNRVPILGICLGHQSIGEVFGCDVVKASRIMHGKVSDVYHNGDGIFEGVNTPTTVMRYHSLIVTKIDENKELVVTALTKEGEVMALKHRKYPVYGMQFHPESIFTKEGKKMIKNFINIVNREC
ncbi:MAG: aminodeoxychorismate/anthranilate synthase component II [Clostridium sp.]|uniref:anthranilate synthase component II n=1 Tax=Clostridium sp. TaxID=1506 RepID=UPI002FCB4000